MEKICIVKRRQQYEQNETKSNMQDSQGNSILSENTLINNIVGSQNQIPGRKLIEEFDDDCQHILSITMTEEQSNMLQKSEYIRELLNGKINDSALDVKRDNDSRIVLNFRFSNSLLLRMLRSDQVCQMLQISRSFLYKLIQEDKLRSYKLGRLRRFVLEDILEYLLSKDEFSQLKE